LLIFSARIFDSSVDRGIQRRAAAPEGPNTRPPLARKASRKDTSTLITCYTQPTNDVMLAVMTEPTKVRDVAVVGRNSP
jgi:hypothetical protein